AACGALAANTPGITGFTLTAPFQVASFGGATVSYSTAPVGGAAAVTNTQLYQSGARSAAFLSSEAAYEFIPAAVNTTPFLPNGAEGAGNDSRFSLTPNPTS